MSHSAPLGPQDVSLFAQAPSTTRSAATEHVSDRTPFGDESSPADDGDLDIPESGVREVSPYAPVADSELLFDQTEPEMLRLTRADRASIERIALWVERAIPVEFGAPRRARCRPLVPVPTRVLHPALDPRSPLEDLPVGRPPQISILQWFWLAFTGA